MFVDLADVRRVLDHDELEPCFQPVVELHTGRLTGFEVLARWRHPQLGLVLPVNFISLAEENGLIGRLTQQILRKAFVSAPILPEPLELAVNVSPVQLHDLSLPGQIREAAEQAGFPLKRVMVEITESGLLNNLEWAQKITGELKEMGCGLALDDFGTGYSSLSLLQALPFDVLKVDRSFVISMAHTRESRKIVAAILGLGHSLGMTTIAEGVETEEQADMLLRLGCEMGQGWFFGRPLEADRIAGMVKALPWTRSSGLPTEKRDWVVSRLEAQPAERLAQLQAIYDGAPVGLCFLDCNLRYVSLNQRLADMDGVQMSAYTGKTVEEVIPWAFPTIEAYLRRALLGEAIPEAEITLPMDKSGQEGRTHLVSYQPAFDEAGEVIGISLSVVDITERKRTVDALQESETHLRYMVELNPQIPWVMDSEGNNLDVSSRWTRTTGLSKEQSRDMGWLEAVHPDDVEPTLRALRVGLHAGNPIDIEYRVGSPGQGWRWMRSQGSPRFGPSGEILRWYGSVEDIDQRKRMEDELRKIQV
jgi:PAS domain S-box-containing protein